jgi:hypothetical protein
MHYYSVKEASVILGFSTNSIYKFCDTGRLKANRGNSQTGRYKIPHSSLEKFLGTTLSEAAINQALMVHTVESTQIKKEISTQSNITPKQVVNSVTEPSDTPLPLNIIRILIIAGLVLILIDILFNPDFSVFQQFLRLSLMGILIILTYQFGGLSHSS